MTRPGSPARAAWMASSARSSGKDGPTSGVSRTRPAATSLEQGGQRLGGIARAVDRAGQHLLAVRELRRVEVEARARGRHADERRAPAGPHARERGGGRRGRADRLERAVGAVGRERGEQRRSARPARSRASRRRRARARGAPAAGRRRRWRTRRAGARPARRTGRRRRRRSRRRRRPAATSRAAPMPVSAAQPSSAASAAGSSCVSLSTPLAGITTRSASAPTAVMR